jgi:hypothetical protein
MFRFTLEIADFWCRAGRHANGMLTPLLVAIKPPLQV